MVRRIIDEHAHDWYRDPTELGVKTCKLCKVQTPLLKGDVVEREGFTPCATERPARKTICQGNKGHTGSHHAVIYWEDELADSASFPTPFHSAQKQNLLCSRCGTPEDECKQWMNSACCSRCKHEDEPRCEVLPKTGMSSPKQAPPSQSEIDAAATQMLERELAALSLPKDYFTRVAKCDAQKMALTITLRIPAWIDAQTQAEFEAHIRSACKLFADDAVKVTTQRGANNGVE